MHQPISLLPGIIFFEKDGKLSRDGFDVIQALVNDANSTVNVVPIPAYTLATVPDATQFADGSIIVSNESGGRTVATSDGLVWRRVSDGAVIS